MLLLLILECHVSCLTCVGPLAGSCSGCGEGHRLESHREEAHGRCVPSDVECSPHEYVDQRGDCRPCHNNCRRCSGPGKNRCVSCRQRDLLLSEFNLLRKPLSVHLIPLSCFFFVLKKDTNLVLRLIKYSKCMHVVKLTKTTTKKSFP